MAIGLLVELDPKTKNNNMIYDALKELLEEKTLVSNPKPTYPLEIEHLHSLAKKVVADETIKLVYPDLLNAQLAVVKVSEQYPKKYLKSSKIRIFWVECRVPMSQPSVTGA